MLLCFINLKYYYDLVRSQEGRHHQSINWCIKMNLFIFRWRSYFVLLSQYDAMSLAKYCKFKLLCQYGGEKAIHPHDDEWEEYQPATSRFLRYQHQEAPTTTHPQLVYLEPVCNRNSAILHYQSCHKWKKFIRFDIWHQQSLCSEGSAVLLNFCMPISLHQKDLLFHCSMHFLN